MTVLLGIDAGGTFTDFIVYKNDGFVTHKILSTPDDPRRAILAGIKSLGLEGDKIHMVHGTTVATNAFLEGNGAPTAFVTNQGFKDLLHIGRQTRSELYSLCPKRPRELIPTELCFEIAGRILADGTEIGQPSSQDIAHLKDQLDEHNVQAVAVCMLFSFLNSGSEELIEDALKDQYFVSCSSQLLPEQREYERAVVTWLNSYLGPLTRGYLQNLQTALGNTTVHVMQSDATTIPAAVASKQAVRLLLSGPAGGIMAASVMGQQAGKSQLLTIDMGGTSTDVAMIDGQPKCTIEGHLGEFPLVIPMLDIHTIGAGGGSIARVDAAGGLHVGPESAGAQPGPACYGGGGQQATITDANVVLGRLPHSHPWACGLQLDYELACGVISELARQLECSMTEAAQGILTMANAQMAQALRVISIHRGYDPSEFCLLPFGGAGGLHMCAVAEALSIKQIAAPVHCGILSAQGMLYAPVGQMASQSICQLLSEWPNPKIDKLFVSLYQRAVRHLESANLVPSRHAYYLDLRYRGQSSTISIAWHKGHSVVDQFQQEHLKRFGFDLDADGIELVTVRVWVYQDIKHPEMSLIRSGASAKPIDHVSVVGVDDNVPIYRRLDFTCAQKIDGPSIVLDESGTIYIAEGWSGHVDKFGHLHLQKETNCQ